MQTFSKMKQRNASIDSNQSLLHKIGCSRSYLASVYFNNRQSLKPNEIETVTLSLLATSLMRI